MWRSTDDRWISLPRTADVSPRSSPLRDVSPRETSLSGDERGETSAEKRPSVAMSEEKRLPFAGYRWFDYLVFELFITLSPFNSCFGGYVSRSRLARSRCSNEKRIANSSSSEREARRTFTSFIFSFAFGRDARVTLDKSSRDCYLPS